MVATVTPKISVHGCVYAPTNHDGDSFYCTGDARPVVPDCKLWQPHVRLAFVNAPERGEPGWDTAAVFLTAWLSSGPFTLVCYGREKYGRELADAVRGNEKLSAVIVAAGLAARMSTTATRGLLVDG